jgi:hypothetical protein
VDPGRDDTLSGGTWLTSHGATTGGCEEEGPLCVNDGTKEEQNDDMGTDGVRSST